MLKFCVILHCVAISGFSRTLIQILNDCNVKFSSFDILSDESVRQGLFLIVFIYAFQTLASFKK